MNPLNLRNLRKIPVTFIYIVNVDAIRQFIKTVKS